MNWGDQHVTLRIYAERTNPHAAQQRKAAWLATQHQRAEVYAQLWREERALAAVQVAELAFREAGQLMAGLHYVRERRHHG